MLKIISSDSIPTDYSNESVHLFYIPDTARDIAQKLCDAMNATLGDHQGPYYRVVDQSHELYRWKP